MAVTYQQLIDNYNAQKRAQQDFLKQQQANQVKQLKAQTDKQIADINTTYNENARRAYIQREQARRDLPQQLAAQGISGGLSESGNIALNTAYGNALSGYKGQRDSDTSNVKLQYGNDLASLNNTYLGKLSENNSYYDQLIAQQRAAQLQAEEEARHSAVASTRSYSGSGNKTNSGNGTNSAYIKRAQSLLDKDGRSAYDYLKNLLEAGYINQEGFSGIAAQIGLTDPMIRKYITADDIANTGRAAAYYINPANRVAAVARGGIASILNARR